MSHYKHLSITERESIWEMKIQGASCRQMAAAVGRSASTVCRELSRNSNYGYRPSRAQAKYKRRRKHSGKKRLLDNVDLRTKVLHLLAEQQWSPEQISQRLALENNGQISYNTIYRALKQGQIEPPGARKTKYNRYPLQQHLRRKGKNYTGKKPRAQGFVHQSIDQRPDEANTRSELGHWEGDLVYSSHHKKHIVTMVDRLSRFLLTTNAPNKMPSVIASVMTELLCVLPEDRLKTITLDRGIEFADHSLVTKAIPHAQFYFAHPMAPWERGLNENTNGLLRQYVPKHSCSKPFSDELLKEFTDKLNHRPRKYLGWKSPFEVFFNTVLHLT